MQADKTKDESYSRRRDWLLEKIRRENWSLQEDKPRRTKNKVVKIKKMK